MPKDWDSVKAPRTFGHKRRVSMHFGYKPEYAVKILRNIMTEEVLTEPYKHELRISKLPYCGLLDTIEQIEKPARTSKYGMSFYTSVGTAVHENIQNKFAASKKYGHLLIGRWKCSACGFVTKDIGPKPEHGICPQCKNNHPTLKYEEVDFMYKGRVSGHCDGLTLDKRKNYVAWEYKTTSEDNIANPEKYLPYPKHIVQIETYCALLRHQYGIVPKAFYIIYLNRNKSQDDPDRPDEFVVFGFKVKAKRLDFRLQHLDDMVRSSLLIKKIFKEPTKDHIKRLEEIRPCRSQKDYDGLMKHHFFGDACCPFLEGETCFMNRSKLTEAGQHIFKLLNKKHK